MFLAIYKYIDRIFSIARPRKLLFMAIDGVAPRAKLNQQRARRFKSAKEMEEKKSKEMNIYESKCYRAAGKPDEELPKMPTFWDHNVITPGTPFMHKEKEMLSKQWGSEIQNSQKEVGLQMVWIWNPNHLKSWQMAPFGI